MLILLLLVGSMLVMGALAIWLPSNCPRYLRLFVTLATVILFIAIMLYVMTAAMNSGPWDVS